MSDFKKINSSNLEAACYNGTSKEMIVQFKGGTQYRYFDIPQELWNEFADTFSGEDGKSAGKFFHANIRQLPNEKIED
jgi:hypothetical protein